MSVFTTPSAAQNSNASAAPGTADRAPDAKAQPSASAPPKLIYRPPVRGAPGGRVGGGSRGSERELFLLLALAPEHSALTALEQPTLYWYISRPTELPIEFTLIDTKGTQPLVETRIASPTSAGVQRLSLSNYDVKLTPGVAYRWYVAVIADPQRRSKDILAGGAVERVEVPEQAATALRAAPGRRDLRDWLKRDCGMTRCKPLASGSKQSRPARRPCASAQSCSRKWD